MARDLQYKNPPQEFELQDTNGVCDRMAEFNGEKVSKVMNFYNLLKLWLD
ncbi:hypothetical protein [Helicobacter pametensis]|nr:hypothetical protein [Helicobacter pametensis]